MSDEATVTFKIRTGWDEEDRIVQQIEDPEGGVMTAVVDVAAQLLDAEIRAELIRQGWTPPPKLRSQ